jgi:hypothetical protein
MHIPPEVWGPFFWNTMHLVALGYSSQPTYTDKRAAKEFYESLTRLIPCPTCRNHYTAYLKEMPISSSLDNRTDLFRWTINLHNKVNKLLNKPEKTEAEVLAYYTSLGERGRSPIWGMDDMAEVNTRSFLRGVATSIGITAVAGIVIYVMRPS